MSSDAAQGEPYFQLFKLILIDEIPKVLIIIIWKGIVQLLGTKFRCHPQIIGAPIKAFDLL